MALINYVHRIFHEYSVIYYQDTKRFYFLKIQNKKIKYADIYQKKKKKVCDNDFGNAHGTWQKACLIMDYCCILKLVKNDFNNGLHSKNEKTFAEFISKIDFHINTYYLRLSSRCRYEID